MFVRFAAHRVVEPHASRPRSHHERATARGEGATWLSAPAEPLVAGAVLAALVWLCPGRGSGRLES